MRPIAHLLPTLPGLPAMTGPRTYAAWPVWSGSTAEPVTFQPTPKKKALKLWHRARAYERQTRQPGHQDGALGRNGIAVLQVLIFDCLNYASGRLDPAIGTIARLAAISARSAARGLAALKAAGVVNWLRRCTGRMEDGRYVLRQDTNAYALLPSSQWRGYMSLPEAPPPERGTWGDHPPLPDALTAAVLEQREGGGAAGAIRELESDPGNVLAAALARLGRAMEARKNGGFIGLPN